MPMLSFSGPIIFPLNVTDMYHDIWFVYIETLYISFSILENKNAYILKIVTMWLGQWQFLIFLEQPVWIEWLYEIQPIIKDRSNSGSPHPLCFFRYLTSGILTICHKWHSYPWQKCVKKNELKIESNCHIVYLCSTPVNGSEIVDN